MTDLFEPVLAQLNDKDRGLVIAALTAVENAVEPISEEVAAGLRDATLRRCVDELLHPIGRTLVRVDQYRWTSGYRDDITTALVTEGWCPLTDTDRAVLTLILIFSVAIPRSEGRLNTDSWTSSEVTPHGQLRKRAHIPAGELRESLGRLRAAGLVKQARSKAIGPDGQRESGYVPGSQFHRLTPTARTRLQDELILAAGPDTPLAAAIRARRGTSEGTP